MPKYLHLQIPEPCHEDWNKMDPQAQGRFCNSCQKTVTDFTNMSDAQLIAFFKNPKPSVCGRFTGEQLERDILIPRKRIPWIKYFFQFVLPAFLISLKASAQAGKIKALVEKISVQKFTSTLLGDNILVRNPNTCSSPQLLQGKIGGVMFSTVATRNIAGTVTDNYGKPLAGATVSIKGTSTETVTDTSGNFLLVNVSHGSAILASFIGFESKEIVVANTEKPLNIQLEYFSTRGLVEVVVGYPAKKKKKIKKDQTCIKPAEPTLSLYPNPLKSTSSLRLKWENFEEGFYRIEMYNTAGILLKSEKLVYDKGIKETSLTIDELAAGNYFIRLINEKTGRQLSQQFIVQE